MCRNVIERRKLIRLIDSEYKEKGERWALIKNRSNRLEVVPEKSLPIENVEVIYQLTD